MPTERPPTCLSMAIPSRGKVGCAVAERPWLQHYPAEVAANLDYPPVPLHDLLRQAAAEFPARSAIIFFGRRTSYADLWRQSLALAKGLRARGVESGDRVAISLPNCPQAIVALYGVLAAGAVAVPCNPLYTERELRGQLEDSGARALIALDLLAPRVQAVRDDLDFVAYTGMSDALPFHLARLYRLREKVPQIAYGPKTLRLSDLKADGTLPEVDPGALALLQYTGGTTGTPKGVMLTHANVVANTLQGVAWLHRMRRGQEIILAVLPFFHVYGLSAALSLGVATAATLVPVPRFDIKQMVGMIAHYRPTIFPGAPTIYAGINRYLGEHPVHLRSLQAGISGSAPLPAEVQSRFESLTGINLVEGYGLSEASPVTHCNPVWGERRPGSIGLPWPDTDAKVVDQATGAALPAGEVGELCVRGPQVMRGYWQRPEETADVLGPDGWLRTGDLARMDADGFFYIVGRLKDVIIAGGYNIYPREVEEVLYAHPAVAEAAVVGVPDPYRGETVRAFVQLRSGASAMPAELDAFCRERLAAYKVPRQYEFRAELPKSAVGKVLHRVLREEAAQQQSAG